MVEDSVSKESLDEPGGSIFLEFIVDALLLPFVIDVFAPLLLDLDCRCCSFQKIFCVNGDILCVAFEQGHHLRSFYDFLELKSFGVVIKDHSDELLHDEFVLALIIAKRLVILMLEELVDSVVGFVGFG